jgi:hypothetical protein
MDQPRAVGAVGAGSALIPGAVPPLQMRVFGEENAGVIGAPHPFLAVPLSATAAPLAGSTTDEVALLVRRLSRLREG